MHIFYHHNQKSHVPQNTIPCRVTLKKQQTWKDLIRLVHQSNLDCLPWQHASLRSIQQALHTSGLCDTLFLFQPEDAQPGVENKLWRSISRADEVQTKSQVWLRMLSRTCILIHVHPVCHQRRNTSRRRILGSTLVLRGRCHGPTRTRTHIG